MRRKRIISRNRLIQKEDTDIELVNDQREKTGSKKPVEIKEIKKKEEIELDETNSQITGGHSTKENQSEISELKTISDQQSSQRFFYFN